MSTDPTSATRDAPNRTPTDEPRAGQPATRADPWTAEGTDRFATARAPRTFDPFCTHRLRNTCDDANAAQLRER
jgi:hypothetical protein